MKSRDDYEFIIPPWEYRGANFDPRPDAIVEVVGTFRQEMMLKVKQNYLFVREAGDDPSRTFAVLQPLAETSKEADQLNANPESLIQLFQEASTKGNLAKMHCLREQSSGYASSEMHVIGFLCPNGRGVFREFWDDDGIPFQITQFSKEMWPQDWIVDQRIKAAWNAELAEALQNRELSEEVFEGEPVRWLCGSEDQLNQLITWLVHAFSNEESVMVYVSIAGGPLLYNNGLTSFTRMGRVPGQSHEK